jgi:hypothetical protein
MIAARAALGNRQLAHQSRRSPIGRGQPGREQERGCCAPVGKPSLGDHPAGIFIMRDAGETHRRARRKRAGEKRVGGGQLTLPRAQAACSSGASMPAMRTAAVTSMSGQIAARASNVSPSRTRSTVACTGPAIAVEASAGE